MDGVTFDALGKSQSLRLTTGAGARLERKLGVPFAKLIKTMDDELGFSLAIAFFACCLNDGAGVADKYAEAVIDDIGGLMGAAEILAETVAASMPEVGKDEAPGKGNGKKGQS